MKNYFINDLPTTDFNIIFISGTVATMVESGSVRSVHYNFLPSVC